MARKKIAITKTKFVKKPSVQLAKKTKKQSVAAAPVNDDEAMSDKDKEVSDSDEEKTEKKKDTVVPTAIDTTPVPETNADNTVPPSPARRSDRIRESKSKAKKTLYEHSVAKMLSVKRERDSKKKNSKDAGEITPFTPGKQLDDEFFFPGWSSSDEEESGKSQRKKRKTLDSPKRDHRRNKGKDDEEYDTDKDSTKGSDEDSEPLGDDEPDLKKEKPAKGTRAKGTRVKKEKAPPKNTALFNVDDDLLEKISNVKSDMFTGTSNTVVQTKSKLRANMEAIRAVQTKNYDLLKKVRIL
jgi:hypothetical protein